MGKIPGYNFFVFAQYDYFRLGYVRVKKCLAVLVPPQRLELEENVPIIQIN